MASIHDVKLRHLTTKMQKRAISKIVSPLANNESKTNKFEITAEPYFFFLFKS